MSQQQTDIVEIRRTVKESIDAVESIRRSDLVYNVAKVTESDTNRVTDEVDRMERLGEIYKVPTEDDGTDPVVKRP